MSSPLDRDEIIKESRAGADVGQLLRHELIDVGVTWTQLVPPDRQRNRNTRFDAISYARGQVALASIVPDLHDVAVLEGIPKKRIVRRVESVGRAFDSGWVTLAARTYPLLVGQRL